MTDRTDVLRVVSCLIEDIRYLRQNSHTRLNGYSTQFLREIRKEIGDFNAELVQLINRQMKEKTGDPRPFIEDVREHRGSGR
jgi:hypothetical protein